MNFVFFIRGLVPLLAVAAILISPGASAQEDKRVAQTREALRRAQQSLQSVQAERDTLQQDKARLEQQKQQVDQALADAAGKQREIEAQRSGLSRGLSEAQADRNRLAAELKQAREESEAWHKRLDESQGQVAEARTRADDQRRTSVALRDLLQRSVQSLADNEHQNRQLYDIGHRALADYQDCQQHGSTSPDGNLLGLGDVRTTSVAEELRREMDAVAAPTTLARPGTPARHGIAEPSAEPARPD
jgi:chromosome segregation ATPase